MLGEVKLCIRVGKSEVKEILNTITIVSSTYSKHDSFLVAYMEQFLASHKHSNKKPKPGRRGGREIAGTGKGVAQGQAEGEEVKRVEAGGGGGDAGIYS